MSAEYAQWIEDYLRATENEIAVDTHLYSMGGGSAAEYGYLPRAAKWRGMTYAVRPLLRVAGSVARILWKFGASRAYLTFDTRRLGRHRRACSSAPHDLPSGCRELAIAFSSRAADVLHLPALVSEPTQWLTFPWASIHPLPAGQAQCDAFSLISHDDMRLALKLARRASESLARRPSTRLWALQGYTAVRWFVARIALEKFTNCRFLIAEHYDRWAVLADAVARANTGLTLTLVQHGALAGLSNSNDTQDGRLHFRLPNRLACVSRLSIYDASSESVFLNDVFTPECVAKGVTVRMFKPRIELTSMGGHGRASVLIVGHTLCEPLHIGLMQSLSRADLAIDVFYKPHPTTRPGGNVGRQRWQVIQERSVFPEVDMIVSYPSTLVTEYANAGVPALVHSLDAQSDTAAALADDVLARIAAAKIAIK